MVSEWIINESSITVIKISIQIDRKSVLNQYHISKYGSVFQYGQFIECRVILAAIPIMVYILER